MPREPNLDETLKQMRRREFIRRAAEGSLLTAIAGGIYYFSTDSLTREAQAQTLPDGRSRLPPGQRVIEKLKAMGGQEGDASFSGFRLQVHGTVEAPRIFDFRALQEAGVIEQKADVHCVTGWSVLDATWTGVRIDALARLVMVKPTTRHVIFEAAHGYTANVPLADALLPSSMVAWKLDGETFATEHGAPVRGLVPHLYFWKSAKWLTAIRFSGSDEPGYWETRGYHNRADPWREERHG